MDINRNYREKLLRTLNKTIVVNFYSNQSYSAASDSVDVNFDGYTSSILSPCLNENLLNFKNPNEIQIVCGALFDSEAHAKNILFLYLTEDTIPSYARSYCNMQDMAKNTANYLAKLDFKQLPYARLHFASDDLVDGHQIKLFIDNNYELRDKTVLDWHMTGANLRTDMTKEKFKSIGAEYSFGSAKEQIEQSFVEIKEKLPNVA